MNDLGWFPTKAELPPPTNPGDRAMAAASYWVVADEHPPVWVLFDTLCNDSHIVGAGSMVGQMVACDRRSGHPVGPGEPHRGAGCTWGNGTESGPADPLPKVYSGATAYKAGEPGHDAPLFAVGDFVSLATDPSSYGQVVEIERYGDDGWMCSVDFGGPGLDGIEQSHLTTPTPQYFDTAQPVPINVDGPTKWTISVGDGQVTQFDPQGNEGTPDVEIDGDSLTFRFAAPIVGEPKVYVIEDEPPWAGLPEYRVARFTYTGPDATMGGYKDQTGVVLGTVVVEGQRSWIVAEHDGCAVRFTAVERVEATRYLPCDLWEIQP